MIRDIRVRHPYGLADYRAHLELDTRVAALVDLAGREGGALRGRRVWMLSSTAQGGGVAEMMPSLVGLLRELGLDVQWLVIGTEEERFFHLTKRLHTLVHDAEPPEPELDEGLYQDVSRRLADELLPRVGGDDILIVHDPQPLGCGAIVARETGIPAVWRSHIGFDQETERTARAWRFLEPWLEPYRRCVFSLRDYVPRSLLGRCNVIPPAIDPLSHKNRPLPVPKLVGVLRAAGLLEGPLPPLVRRFRSPAMRLRADGRFGPALELGDLGLLHLPIIAQLSRWDRLKGWDGLLEGFVRLKEGSHDTRHRRRIRPARLVLAGPEPSAVSDDPEAQAVLDALVDRWRRLPARLRRDVAVLSLPIDDRKANALSVNALQRCAGIVVQNSRREGFGLTVTEAMWKARPVLGSSAVGIRSQIRDRRDGRLIDDADDPDEIADALGEMLADPKGCETYGLNAAKRVADEFLVLHQAASWIRLLHRLA